MPTPSLLIVPARFKTGKLYSQIPTSGAGDFTVTRNTEARRFGPDGLIASVASGIPRLDYYTSGGVTGCPALLVEPAATNICLQSQAFNTTWTNAGNNLSISANVSSTLDPAGENTAELLTVVTGSTQSQLSQDITTVSGTAYVFSFFGKKGSGATELNSFRIFGSSNISSLTINWDTGVITHTTGSGATSQNFGNGWWRIVIPFTANSTTTTVQIVAFTTYATALSSLRWGAQLETGSVATSYIPTTAGTGSRSADVISVSGAVSGSIGQTEGTIYAEVDVRTFASSSARSIVNLRVDGNNLLSLEINAASTNVEFVATSGGVSVTAVASGLTAGITKIAVGYNSAASGTVLYVNGTLRDTKTIAIPNLSAAVFGLGVRGDGGAGTQLNDRIRAVALYTTRLTDAELATLTTL